ncbi:MAG: hypothetical protein ACYTBS_11715 [Planctomycetota bacterium]|jgi:hypothetical protein
MRRDGFRVMKSVVVLAMLMPAMTLAQHDHLGYLDAYVVETMPVAPGATITVHFEYEVYIGSNEVQQSLWEVRLDGVTGNRNAPAAVLVSGTEPVQVGSNVISVDAEVQIPVDTGEGQHTIDIFSCAWDYRPVADFQWYLLPGTNDPIEITVQVEQQDIIEFFDAAVADGTLAGRGALPAVAEFRLNLMRALLEIADVLILEGQVDLARFFLELAYDFTDGQPGPMDLVEGDAAPELATRIQVLIDSLG